MLEDFIVELTSKPEKEYKHQNRFRIYLLVFRN